MRLRQIALVGCNLDQVSADIVQVLGLGPAFDDPAVGKYGLKNQVWPVGDTFLEVVSPAEDGTTAGRLLERRGGDGGYMAIFQVDDIEAARARVAALGVRVVGQADREGVAMTQLHPRDTGGAIMSLDAMEPPERWDWGGPDWRANVRTETSVAIVGAELQGDDPDALSARWAEVLGLGRERQSGTWVIGLAGGTLKFVEARDGRGEGLGAFDVAVRDPASVLARAQSLGTIDDAGNVVLCGTRVTLVAAAD